MKENQILQPAGRGRPIRERWLVIGLCAAMGWFYGWTVRSSGAAWDFGAEQRDYYNLLIDGYLDGQLHLKVDVPEALLQVKNPYDPAQRPAGVGLHDASFFQGRYYVYFGAAPMIVLMLPFRLITGMDLPLTVAVLAFTYGGFLASVAVWLAVRRRYFPETGGAVVGAGVLMLGLAAGGPVLLRRPDMWELPIAGGYCFALLTLGCVWRSLHDERRRWVWFAGAGLCYGLAIASRPTYLIASPLFAVPLVAWWRSERRWPWRLALSAAVPLAMVGSLMAWHNYARFGNPLQFGQAYQLSLDYESQLPHFRAAYVPYTVRTHFFSPAEWARYFPFIRPGGTGRAPEGFTIHRGDVYGILLYFPVAWLAFVAPLACWRRPKAERGPLATWIGTVAVLFALAAVVLLFFFSALARYQLDFVPAFILLAAVGLLAVERWLELAAGTIGRRLVRTVWGAAVVFSGAFGVLFSVVFDGLLAEHNPRLEREVARALNRIPAVIERGLGVRHGSVELTLRFPPERRAGRETLLTVGQPPHVDRVFVRTRDDGKVELGVAPAGGAEQMSRPLSPDLQQTHRVRVTLGSLHPPASHPWFEGKSPAEVRRALRELRVEWDGETVLTGHARPGVARSRPLRVGDAAAVDATYPYFRGVLDAVRRAEAAPAGPANPAVSSGPLRPEAPNRGPLAGAGDTVRLQLKLPAGRSGQREPLIVSGWNGAGDILMIEYADGQTIRFALDHWGSPLRVSPPVRLDYLQPHAVEIAMTSLRTVEDVTLVREAQPGQVRIRVDGTLVWEEKAEFFAAEAAEIAVGRNPIGGTTCGPVFTGDLIAAERVVRE